MPKAPKPVCPECGSEEGIYVAVDLRWNADYQQWEIAGLRESDCGEKPLDCSNCDHRFDAEDGNFPDPLAGLAVAGSLQADREEECR